MQQDLNKLNKKFYPRGFYAGTSGYCHGRKTRTVVVLIHGLFSNSRFFDLNAKELYDQGYNVLNLTLPGHEHGPSGQPNDDYEQWLTYTETMLRYARQWGEQVVVVGHSFGGALAVLLARKKLVDGLVLLHPALKVSTLSHGLFSLRQTLTRLRPRDQRIRFMRGTAESAFQLWQEQPQISKMKINIPTLLYSSRVDMIVSEAGHLEFAQINQGKVELIRHYQIHMANMYSDFSESGRVQNFLERNFSLKKGTSSLFARRKEPKEL